MQASPPVGGAARCRPSDGRRGRVPAVSMMTLSVPPISVGKGRLALSRWDALAVLLILGLLVFLADTSRGLLQPLASLRASPISLDPSHLPGYAARTTLRMLAALGLSLLFTFTYATLAAKSRRAELLLLPLLDILQSVPILGFISVTVVFFMSLAPDRVLGRSSRRSSPALQPAVVGVHVLDVEGAVAHPNAGRDVDRLVAEPMHGGEGGVGLGAIGVEHGITGDHGRECRPDSLGPEVGQHGIDGVAGAVARDQGRTCSAESPRLPARSPRRRGRRSSDPSAPRHRREPCGSAERSRPPRPRRPAPRASPSAPAGTVPPAKARRQVHAAIGARLRQAMPAASTSP